MATIAANLSRRLEGKVAIITGGASGIGEAAAGLFTKHGAKVIVADITKKAGQSFSPDVTYTHCDVSREEDVSAAVDLAMEKHGKLDIMFNNAGVADKENRKAMENNMEEFERVVNVNIKGVMHGIKHAARVMVPRKNGCIISTASIAGIVGGMGSYAYTSSKHAVIGLTKQGAAEMGRYGIRVNCVSPSPLATDIVLRVFEKSFPMSLSPEELKANWEAFCNKIANLKDHTLRAQDIAEAALYLASEESKFVSGHNVVVDGGKTVVNHDLGLYQ
ncbi:short-chain dehydrogenase reductase 2a [Cryptomeria japonica]|uniref:short-chain dehydrogenase reductase 2a n=1 Tax=Cryptomeria japonica TaxID=3369 RepID=UPI0027DA8044|nr:short-chain dehydrogenase reductase 2a [Cryptomeria japonica]